MKPVEKQENHMNTPTAPITVIHHSADFDGIFCREICKKFLGTEGVQYFGWDFKDAPLPIPPEGTIYILDLPVDRVFGFNFADKSENIPIGELYAAFTRIVWIDHHKSSIETHPTEISGYRIDGVAACRLAWQWFCDDEVPGLPSKEAFLERRVPEPYAVTLAGEYDIWDHERSNHDDEAFQFGLRSVDLTPERWDELLSIDMTAFDNTLDLVRRGRLLMEYQQKADANMMKKSSFLVEFEGLKFLAINTARANSRTFESLDVPETGHDALTFFYFDGKAWNVSLRQAKHRHDIDLSKIAVKYGGGGHRGAAGFSSLEWPLFSKPS